MRRFALVLSLLTVFVLSPALDADVKTRERSQLKFEGFMGRLMGMAGGAAARDGVVSTVAVKGSRKIRIDQTTGQIIDLAEEKVYDIDVRKKEYRVRTFAQLREEWKRQQAEAEKAAKDMPAEDRQAMSDSAKEVEITVDVKESGETKAIAGQNAKLVVVTVTAKGKGMSLEEGGGLVITNDVWVGPKVAALDEITQFDIKFYTAIYGPEMVASAQQVAAALAMYPQLQKMMSEMERKLRALDGTVLMTTMKTETVKSAEAMKQAEAPPASGGGLGGALARRLAGNRGKPEQRSLLFTSTNETQSIDTSASDADVAIPTGFKEKK